MPRFQRKVLYVDAFQWTGTIDQLEGLIRWTNSNLTLSIIDNQVEDLHVTTLNGLTAVKHGDWLVKDSNGHMWTTTNEDFQRTYEPAAKEKR